MHVFLWVDPYSFSFGHVTQDNLEKKSGHIILADLAVFDKAMYFSTKV